MIPIKCHADAPRYSSLEIEWRRPDALTRPDGWKGSTYRSCSYCGCMHPEDLLAALKSGAKAGGSDWKYGWPHKFYISNISHDHEDAEVKIGSNNGTPMMGKFGKDNGKWYNEHLKDLPDALFEELTALLFEQTGIQWKRDEKGIKYAAPNHGYQR